MYEKCVDAKEKDFFVGAQRTPKQKPETYNEKRLLKDYFKRFGEKIFWTEPKKLIHAQIDVQQGVLPHSTASEDNKQERNYVDGKNYKNISRPKITDLFFDFFFCKDVQKYNGEGKVRRKKSRIRYVVVSLRFEQEPKRRPYQNPKYHKYQKSLQNFEHVQIVSENAKGALTSCARPVLPSYQRWSGISL